MYLSKPIIRELNISQEQRKEVERIIADKTEYRTKKKDKIRALIHASLCCICSDLPSREISYDMGGMTRLEGYCDKHFEVFESTKDKTIKQIAEEYGCIKLDNISYS